jgi:predicted metal-dependent peptidase
MSWVITQLERGRAIVQARSPFFGAGLHRFNPVASSAVPYLGVDQHSNLYFNEANLATLKTPSVPSLLVHELLHVLDRHSERAIALGINEETLPRWRIAADLALWRPMQESGWAEPGYITPSDFGFPENLLLEEYYSRVTPEMAKSLDEALRGGSCATGIKQPWETEGPRLGGATNEIVRRGVRVAWESWKSANPGNSSFAGLEVVLKCDPPRIPWQQVLSAATKGSTQGPGKVDWSWRRPSRRASAHPSFLRPSLARPTPRVAIVADVSSSMENGDLQQLIGEVQGVIKAVASPDGVTLLGWNTALTQRERKHRATELSLAVGGGTDMGEALHYLETSRDRPDVAIVLTDGWTPWPPRQPRGIRVVVVLAGKKTNTLAVPPWAQGIEHG